MMNHPNLFPAPERPPLVVAYGMGVDSTAMLIRLHEAGDRPDAILFWPEHRYHLPRRRNGR